MIIKLKKKKKANEVVFRILSLLARSGHVAEMLIQVAHIRSSGMAQPLGKLRSFSPTDNCDCLDSNLPRNASHRWRERDKETEREREKGGWIRRDDFSSRPFQTGQMCSS